VSIVGLVAFQPPVLLAPSPRSAAAALAVRMAAPVEEKEKQSFGQKLWSINTANKMKMTKVGEKPKVRGRKLPAEVLQITKLKAEGGKFRKEYPMKELEVLWGALFSCYGSEALATQAVKENWQIINPSYSFPNTLIASRDTLFEMMGKEEAIEVMLLNPAVLQCGPSLDTLGPDEIKGFANIRAIGKKIPEDVVVPAIVLLIALVCYPAIAIRVEGVSSAVESTSAATNVVKAICGVLFAVIIEGSRIAIVGTIVKAKVAGDEKAKAAIEKAAANEKRRMGRAQ